MSKVLKVPVLKKDVLVGKVNCKTSMEVLD